MSRIGLARLLYSSAKLFENFACELADLWRFEAGIPVADTFRELTGWDHFLAAQKTGRGVLVVTPHLGNWEFGAPLLTKHGYKLHVITLVEPGHGLTELRQRRAHGGELKRWSSAATRLRSLKSFAGWRRARPSHC